MIYVIIVIFVILFVLNGVRIFVHNKLENKINTISGPPTIPFIGNLHLIYGDSEYLWNIGRMLINSYYPIFTFWTPIWLVINIRHPDDIETVLTSAKCIDKSVIYTLLRPWLRKGLLTSTEKKWQHRRKILTSAFHFTILQKYMEVLLEHGENMIRLLQKEGGEPIKHLQSWLSDYTLSVICETAMGTSLENMDKKQALKYKEAVDDISASITYRFTRPWFLSEILFLFTPMGWKHRRALKTVHEFSTNIINERKKFHEETNGIYLTQYYSTKNDNDIKQMGQRFGNKKLAMLDLLIAAYKSGQINDIGIREEVDTFIFEGYDTTAAAFCFSIMLLAEHTEIQADVRAEIDQIWEQCEGKINMAEVQKFSYLERCIKEAMRLYPSVPFLSRKIKEDLHLKKYTIPAGVIINIHVYDVHQDPNYWPNPLVFDPDRFLPERCKGRHPYSYIPFSGGFRNCIGQKLAMMELKTFLGFLLHNFKVEPIDRLSDMRIKANLVLNANKPLRVKFIPIKNENKKCI